MDRFHSAKSPPAPPTKHYLLTTRVEILTGPENVTRLRRFAIGVIKSKDVSSVGQTMRKLNRNIRLVFDYLRLTRNSCAARDA